MAPKINLMLSLLLIPLFFGCGGSAEQKGKEENASGGGKEVQQRYEEVMAVHDPLMKKMNDLAKTKKELAELESELLTDSVANATGITRVRERQKALQEGHDAMMDWMHQFRKPKESVARDSALHYLDVQQKKIDSVKVTMDRALKQGKKALEEVRPKNP